MPISAKQLFKKYRVTKYQMVTWGTSVTNENEGVYIVSTSNVVDQNLSALSRPIINDFILKIWIEKVPNFLLDNERPTIDKLRKRLCEFWLPDENILYIGKAPKRKNGDALGNRINEYYETEIGDHGPHSGGQWIKTLTNLNETFIYYGNVNNSGGVEKQMLRDFMDNVSKESMLLLKDKLLPLPFANIRYRPGVDKNHGMKKQRL